MRITQRRRDAEETIPVLCTTSDRARYSPRHLLRLLNETDHREILGLTRCFRTTRSKTGWPHAGVKVRSSSRWIHSLDNDRSSMEHQSVDLKGLSLSLNCITFVDIVNVIVIILFSELICV